MPSKKKKYNARFPPARIKKIMQSDEEVGKVAQVVPIIISKSLEIFVEQLLKSSAEVTRSRNARTLTQNHIKASIMQKPEFAFLRDIASTIPDVNPNAPDDTGEGVDGSDVETPGIGGNGSGPVDFSMKAASGRPGPSTSSSTSSAAHLQQHQPGVLNLSNSANHHSLATVQPVQIQAPRARGRPRKRPLPDQETGLPCMQIGASPSSSSSSSAVRKEPRVLSTFSPVMPIVQPPAAHHRPSPPIIAPSHPPLSSSLEALSSVIASHHHPHLMQNPHSYSSQQATTSSKSNSNNGHDGDEDEDEEESEDEEEDDDEDTDVDEDAVGSTTGNGGKSGFVPPTPPPPIPRAQRASVLVPNPAIVMASITSKRANEDDDYDN